MCTFVYGSNDRNERIQLFCALRDLSQSVSTSWIILGDFNCVANLDERIGSPVRLAEIQPFRDCMAFWGVHDLKFHGRFFTWSNKQAKNCRVFCKIDRVLGNDL